MYSMCIPKSVNIQNLNAISLQFSSFIRSANRKTKYLVSRYPLMFFAWLCCRNHGVNRFLLKICENIPNSKAEVVTNFAILLIPIAYRNKAMQFTICDVNLRVYSSIEIMFCILAFGRYNQLNWISCCIWCIVGARAFAHNDIAEISIMHHVINEWQRLELSIYTLVELNSNSVSAYWTKGKFNLCIQLNQ